jgi:hypothetical protein
MNYKCFFYTTLSSGFYINYERFIYCTLKSLKSRSNMNDECFILQDKRALITT